MAKKASKKPSKNGGLQLPVAFGNVSIGEDTCRVGVTAARANLDVGVADGKLCGYRLTGTLRVGQSGDLPGQKTLPGVDDPELSGVFDVKGYSVKVKSISFGLTFRLQGIDLGLLAGLAKREGTLSIEGVEPLPEDEAEGDD
jgi:hypothetical protein